VPFASYVVSTPEILYNEKQLMVLRAAMNWVIVASKGTTTAATLGANPASFVVNVRLIEPPVPPVWLKSTI
jgi:hypothetical protein